MWATSLWQKVAMMSLPPARLHLVVADGKAVVLRTNRSCKRNAAASSDDAARSACTHDGGYLVANPGTSPLPSAQESWAPC
mmetsp:Transcript_67019/g.132153  ORF Transcript_67019/g.132153 Transcript_67019/m.132153 type:complete len:81 (+) Transcript_67019:1420-1662(+)